MVMTDPIADMLTRMRNGLSSRRKSVEVPASRLKVAVAEAMRREGYIDGFEGRSEGAAAVMTIRFKFGPEGEPAIQEIRRFSTPGCRRYRSLARMPRILGGLGVCILTTPKGVLSDREAREKNVGGEVLCTIY